MLSDMSTFGLQLEPFYSRRMRRPGVFVLIYRDLQPANGRFHRRSTIARSMGPSDADRKEGRFERPIFHGHSV